MKQKLAAIAAGLLLVTGISVTPQINLEAAPAEGVSIMDASFVPFSFGTETTTDARPQHCSFKWVPGVWTPACLNLWPGGPPVPKTCNRHKVTVCK